MFYPRVDIARLVGSYSRAFRSHTHIGQFTTPGKPVASLSLASHGHWQPLAAESQAVYGSGLLLELRRFFI